MKLGLQESFLVSVYITSPFSPLQLFPNCKWWYEGNLIFALKRCMRSNLFKTTGLRLRTHWEHFKNLILYHPRTFTHWVQCYNGFLVSCLIHGAQGHCVAGKKPHSNDPKFSSRPLRVYVYIDATEQYLYKASGFAKGEAFVWWKTDRFVDGTPFPQVFKEQRWQKGTDFYVWLFKLKIMWRVLSSMCNGKHSRSCPFECRGHFFLFTILFWCAWENNECLFINLFDYFFPGHYYPARYV